MSLSHLRDIPFNPDSPYFSLAKLEFVRSPTPIIIQRTGKNQKSILEIFGDFAKMDDVKQANFLLQLLSYSSFEPDYIKMADCLEVQLPAAIQRRFRAIVERNGYKLDDGKKVIPKDPNAAPISNTSIVSDSIPVPATKITEPLSNIMKLRKAKIQDAKKISTKKKLQHLAGAAKKRSEVLKKGIKPKQRSLPVVSIDLTTADLGDETPMTPVVAVESDTSTVEEHQDVAAQG